jgi:hypothetical protein
MAYSFQTFSVGEVLTSSKMNQLEVNVRDHIHGTSSGVSATLGALSAVGTITGDLNVTGNVTAYFSDERLKTRLSNLGRALVKVMALDGFRYRGNDLAQSFGYESRGDEVGLSAQQVREVLPEAVCLAPFDDDGAGGSKSGERYLAIRYEKLVPLLVEALKELAHEVRGTRP